VKGSGEAEGIPEEGQLRGWEDQRENHQITRKSISPKVGIFARPID
jgi:hypothetical protein